MPPQHVNIHMVGGALTVSPPVVDLSIGNGDTIQWATHPLGQPFLVCFGASSPFARHHFDQANPASGPIVAPPHGVYKYTVEYQNQRLDPGVVIKP